MSEKRLFKQLSSQERYVIQRLYVNHKSIREIARILERSPSTISRELSRNSLESGRYLGKNAEKVSDARRRLSRKVERIQNIQTRDFIEEKLKQDWSPEQISGRLKQLKDFRHVCHETIYQWIYSDRPDLIVYLTRKFKTRMPRGYSFRSGPGKHIPFKTPISERPQEVDDRKEFGHWESDLVVSNKNTSSLLVTVERKSRFVIIGRVGNKKPQNTRKALINNLSEVPEHMRKSITYDNGMENRDHWKTNKVLKTKSYFCQPYHSWEKGSVENTNGLIRRYLPKKTDLRRVKTKRLKEIQNLLNHRPKKCLNFLTPYEVFSSGCCT